METLIITLEGYYTDEEIAKKAKLNKIFVKTRQYYDTKQEQEDKDEDCYSTLRCYVRTKVVISLESGFCLVSPQIQFIKAIKQIEKAFYHGFDYECYDEGGDVIELDNHIYI